MKPKNYILIAVLLAFSVIFADASPSEADSATFFPDGFLLNDSGTVYVVENGFKRPFVSMDVFRSYGYKLKNVPIADSSSLPLGTPIIEKGLRHPRGTLINDKGTVYFVGQSLRYPFPSQEVFYSWGHGFHKVVPLNPEDRKLPIGPITQAKSGSELSLEYFAPDRTNIQPGETISFTWSVWPTAALVSIATDVELPLSGSTTYANPVLGVVPNFGSRKVTLFTTTEFKLTASLGANEPIAGKFKVNVANAGGPLINSLSASKQSITAGESVSIAWTTKNAGNVSLASKTASGAIGGPNVKAVHDSVIVNPTETTTYTLFAWNSSSDLIKQELTITVVLPKAPVINFEASPKYLNTGGSPVTLTWDIVPSGSLPTLTGLGVIPSKGSTVVYPSQTTFYNIYASNGTGVTSRTITIPVGSQSGPPHSITLSAYPMSARSGEAVTLTWSGNASGDLLSINNSVGVVPLQGTTIVYPQTRVSYILTVSNGNGVSSTSVSINGVP